MRAAIPLDALCLRRCTVFSFCRWCGCTNVSDCSCGSGCHRSSPPMTVVVVPESYLYLRRFLVGRKPTLLGAPEVLHALWPTRLAGGMERLLRSVPHWTPESLASREHHPVATRSAEAD